VRGDRLNSLVRPTDMSHVDEPLVPNDERAAFLARVAEQLVAETAIQAHTDRGRTVEIWTIQSDGVRVTASAPRLEVAAEMRLECRLPLNGETYRIVGVVEDALAQSPSRARLVIRLTAATADALVRRGERVPVAVRATLVAVVCDRIVPDEAMNTVIDDVSEGGFKATVPDNRVRQEDRLRLVGRLLDGVIDCEVRVKWSVETHRRKERRVGCAFINPSAESRQTIDRLRIRFSPPRAA